jgi:hypothetical protein
MSSTTDNLPPDDDDEEDYGEDDDDKGDWSWSLRDQHRSLAARAISARSPLHDPEQSVVTTLPRLTRRGAQT